MHSKSFEEVLAKFSTIHFNEHFDLVIAVANGGIIPAAIINQRLNAAYNIIKIHYRDNKQQPEYDKPKLIEKIGFEYKDKIILLVEDRVKTGASLAYARSLLEGAATIKTFAVNGPADYSLYNESCFRFPWNI